MPKVMQRQVADFLFREASRIARRTSKRWPAVERAPNQAGAVAASSRRRLGDFTDLDLTAKPRLVYVVGDSKRRGTGLPKLLTVAKPPPRAYP